MGMLHAQTKESFKTGVLLNLLSRTKQTQVALAALLLSPFRAPLTSFAGPRSLKGQGADKSNPEIPFWMLPKLLTGPLPLSLSSPLNSHTQKLSHSLFLSYHTYHHGTWAPPAKFLLWNKLKGAYFAKTRQHSNGGNTAIVNRQQLSLQFQRNQKACGFVGRVAQSDIVPEFSEPNHDTQHGNVLSRQVPGVWPAQTNIHCPVGVGSQGKRALCR